MKLRRWNLFAFTCLSLFVLSSNAQELKIGNICPDIPLKNIINYSVTETRLYDFKGKFLILDFWGTGCAACIRAFPKLDSLQKRFRNKLQIIAINKESQDSTVRFFKRMKHIKAPAIPFVTGDTLLSELFPHIYVPHHVWIDSLGVVRYITDGHNATVEHIEQFIKGGDLYLAEKKYGVNYFYDTPLMALTNKVGIDNLESYSLLMHCLSGVTFSNSTISTNSTESPNRLSRNCASIEQLYITAYSEGGKYDFDASNTVILNVKDKAKYIYPKGNNEIDDWLEKNSFNYELKVPNDQSGQLYKIMQMDLYRYFKLKGFVEKRMIKCLSLVKTQHFGRIKSKGGNPVSNFWIITADSVLFMKNQPFERLVTTLMSTAKTHGLAFPLINETNFNGNIDISIKKGIFETFDISQLRSEFRKYGVDLIETVRPVNVLVLKELE